MRDSVVMYRSFMDAMENLDAESYKAAMQGLFHYAMDDKEPELSGAAMMAFLFMKPQIDANNRRYENGKKGAEHGIKGAEYGKKGGRPRKETPGKNPTETHKTPIKPPINPPNVNVNVNDNVNVNEKHIERVGTRSARPTLEEVRNYLREYHPNDSDLIAERFFDYFESNGWKVGGKTPMKDWKAAVRNWCRNESNFGSRNRAAPVQTRFHNLEQRAEDVDAEALALTRKALGI